LSLGWSQVALAFHAGISIGDISRIETGRLRPYPSQLEKLSKVLGLEESALLDQIEVGDGSSAEATERPDRHPAVQVPA
jgi:transcriptional regulator with XRE-family HTH domain